MRILGVDPGFANVGWALVEWVDGGLLVDPFCLGVIETAPGVGLDSDDNAVRGIEIYRNLRPLFERADAVCVERFGYVRQAQSNHKVGICWGVLCALVSVYAIPLIQTGAKSVKKSLCGSESAEKAAVEKALIGFYGPKMTEGLRERHTPRSQWHHAYDALGVAHVLRGDPEIRTVADNLLF